MVLCRRRLVPLLRKLRREDEGVTDSEDSPVDVASCHGDENEREGASGMGDG